MPVGAAWRALPMGPPRERYTADAVARTDRLTAIKIISAPSVQISHIDFGCCWVRYAEYETAEDAKLSQKNMAPIPTTVKNRHGKFIILSMENDYIYNRFTVQFNNGNKFEVIDAMHCTDRITQFQSELKYELHLVNEYEAIKTSYLKLIEELPVSDLEYQIIWEGKTIEYGTIYDKFHSSDQGTKLIRRE
jgi:hypothetical protein